LSYRRIIPIYLLAMKDVARFVSYIFHPLFFPTYGTLLIVGLNPNMFGPFRDKVHFAWLIIIIALTIVFPLVWILMMRGLQMIDSLQLRTSKERIIPFVATATFYLWATWMFKPTVTMKIPPNLPIFYMMLGACFAIFEAFVINVFAKVSLHTLAAGSLTGLTLILIRYSTFDLRLMFVGVILMAGVIGTARLMLKAHTDKEVALGYVAGFTAQFISFSIAPHFF